MPRRRLSPTISPTKISFTVEACAGSRTTAPLVAFLRLGSHDVLYIAEAAAGISDPDVIDLALREKRLLLTEDKDFGDLVFRRERTVPGVVLMRIGPENPALKAMRLAAAIDMAKDFLAVT